MAYTMFGQQKVGKIMAVKYTRPKGTLDVLPAGSWKWKYAEGAMRKAAEVFGFQEMRMPTFESTGLFSRSVGEATDIVLKEMYTFDDKAGRSMTLRPEGTAGVVRAVLENGLLASSPLPLKCYYIQSAFRYENSQKGRYREFHQFGVECYGTHCPESDAEVMAVARHLLNQCGLGGLVQLEINSIGCPECRKAYHEQLRAYFGAREKELCHNCKDRLQENPMRLLDCKEEKCKVIAQDAPIILDYLCDECRNHFEEVKLILSEANMEYIVNPRIVRGLDYYTNTVFEFTANGIGTQGTVCGGGRYNGLIEMLGGQPTPAVGFGLGVERFLMLLEENKKLPKAPAGPFLYAVAQGEKGRQAARRCTAQLRAAGLYAECDLLQRSVKAQMKAAGRQAARYIVVLGDEEAKSGIARLKRMCDSAEAEVPLVALLSILHYLNSEDPLAEGGGDLGLMVESVGPSVIFDD